MQFCRELWHEISDKDVEHCLVETDPQTLVNIIRTQFLEGLHFWVSWRCVVLARIVKIFAISCISQCHLGARQDAGVCFSYDQASNSNIDSASLT